MKNKYNGKLIGKEFITSEGYTAKVIAKCDNDDCVTIQIENWTTEVKYEQLKKGTIKYPYHPNIFGVGYYGEGKYTSKVNGKKSKRYGTWHNMIKRCYDVNRSEKNMAYVLSSVCNEWHNYQVFAEWYENNYVEGWHLDKDLLVEGNKIYSPNTCVFLPMHINLFMSNKYKNNKSGYTGVSWNKRSGKWVAQTSCFNTGKRLYLGAYSNIEDANTAYCIKREEMAIHCRNYAKSVGLKYDVINNLK